MPEKLGSKCKDRQARTFKVKTGITEKSSAQQDIKRRIQASNNWCLQKPSEQQDFQSQKSLLVF